MNLLTFKVLLDVYNILCDVNKWSHDVDYVETKDKKCLMAWVADCCHGNSQLRFYCIDLFCEVLGCEPSILSIIDYQNHCTHKELLDLIESTMTLSFKKYIDKK